MKNLHVRTYDFRLVGGSLAIDFVNTVADRLRLPREKLTSASAFNQWAHQAGLISPRETLSISQSQLRDLIAVREQLYALFRPAATGMPISARSLAQLNRRLRKLAPLRQITPHSVKYSWAWRSNAAPADRLLAPILWDAAELLVSGRFAKIRQCADEFCGWLFLDRSQAGKRRWCSMADCGNRSKVRRFYLREQRPAHGRRMAGRIAQI